MSNFDTAVMLAGGKAKRFEFDKQLLHLQKDSQYANVLPTLNQNFDEVLVVTSKPKLYDDLNVKTIQDIFPQKGPLSGIHAALSFSKSEYAYIIACDMPNIDIDYINYMKQRLISTGADACVTRFADRIEPFHAFYSKNALKTIEEDLLADLCSIKHLLRKINTLYISEEEARQFTPDWSLFQNINF
ncbi:MAG: molybdenum cofactor guanylyltransferase [Oscillospiraceae bacterium]|jgi:molybdopterin-guanine dinucleotide biosynthesis protein A|nr:molybdenum cofactor guanylyltransferase [Oscillospiraceae bacterium]